ncbi:Contains similarity to trehalose-6-phosphate phosphatase from Arabidopsis thaliana gb/AF007779. EST gb/AI995647 comes from this gene [Arabidopsis thaliana]|nr:Contains similarity to trehalose-6-phosphate phosphatase from Arabidopsis thaliana gb/AF007779. EST gb/AI995647 comes from this gene [Arabidopsis thaliana]
MKITDISGKIETLVDSLRDMSPTRVRSSFSDEHVSENDDERSSWIALHPSALDMFEQIMRDAEGKQIIMFLDYDGTLSLITEDHDRAYITDEMREVVKEVATYFKTAIISGRSTDKVQSFVKLTGIHYAGSHGMDIKGPTNTDQVVNVLKEKTKSIPGATVEHNKFCLTVHFRRVDETGWAALAEQVRLVLIDYPKLRLTQGRKVLELRPSIKWDKGKALEFLLNSLGIAESKDVLPVYIGDDRTDEDAFKVLCERGQGFGIIVSKTIKETYASYSLQDPSQVKEFLERLVKWKKQTLGE